MKLTDCCSAPFYEESDLCSECKEHADEQEEHECCQSKENGHKCTCLPKNPLYGQQSEDDGYADYCLEEKQDRDEEDRKLDDSP